MNLSRSVTSSQSGVHPQLDTIVRRHLAEPFRAPFADHNRGAFAVAAARYADHGGALILDSGCGVGESTRQLALTNPDALVIGVDKSAHRLGRQPLLPDNALLIRADVKDFWRLALAAGWCLEQHWLLYPNPWPKAWQLQRRWHGSALFPTLLGLGGRLELRSNWHLYVKEFVAALAIAGQSTTWEALPTGPALTPFEAKYRASGHGLWRCRVALAATSSRAENDSATSQTGGVPGSG